MSLDALSPEILLKIIKYVSMVIVVRGVSDYGALVGEMQLGRGAKHLGRLALCSRRLNILTTPLLYEQFATVAPLPRVLHRLLGDYTPDVTTATTELVTSSLHEEEGDPGIDSALLASMTEDDFMRCDNIVREIASSEDDAAIWSRRLREGYWDAYLALTLTLLPNIKTFEIEEYPNFHDFNADSKFINDVFNRAARLQEEGKMDESGSLSKLRSFKIAYSDTENGLYINTILAFLKPRSVKEVFIHMLSDENFQPRGRRFYTEDLTLQYSCVEGDYLIRFLSCFQDLKRFSYENGGSIVGYHDLLPQKVGQAIMHLKHCLEMLVLTDLDGNGPMGDEEALPLGCLVRFEKLETIITQSDFLLGACDSDDEDDEDESDPEENPERKEWSLVDVLPKSVKKLGLSHCEGKEFGLVRELLTCKEESFPLLEVVRFYFLDGHGPDEEEAQALQRDCYLAGIKFTAIAGSPGIRNGENFFT